MKAQSSLPEGYREYFSVDLKRNKKQAVLVNLLSVLIGAAVIAPMCFVIPISTLFDLSDGLLIYCLRFGALIISMIAYIVLHELTHGLAMKMCGTSRVKYGFSVLYAYAGSDDYYSRGAYIFIALAPIVLFGVLLSAVCAMVPISWFWVAYIVQAVNLSGAAGDLYVTFRFMGFPKDILIRDSGYSMVVYSRG